MTPRPGEPCSCGCGAPVICKGMARPCYRRWLRANRPETGAPPPVSHAERAARSTLTLREAMYERMDAYEQSRRLGFTIAQAAADAGVSASTGARYEAAWQEAQRQEKAA